VNFPFEADELMSAVVGFPRLETPPAPRPRGDDPMRRQVWGVLTSVYPRGRVIERRMDQRYPYPRMFYLTPVGEDGISPEGETAVVIGKFLSERGLGFFYQQPLAHRRMIASLESSEKSWAGFLISITWCRFTRYGWYESGGRFIQAVPSPIAPSAR
jgi:hypothetical protein